MWVWLIFEKPRCHPTIDELELKYIEKSLGKSVQQTMPTMATTPWCDILRSKPVIAIIVASFCRSWNFYMIVLYQSDYLKQLFKFETAEVCAANFLNFISVSKTFILGLGWACRSITLAIVGYYCTIWWNVSRYFTKFG